MRLRLKISFAAIVLACLTGPTLAQSPTAEAEFMCDDDKSIKAVFYPEKVELTLSDGRTVQLPQTISGSGARYADADEAMVFWNKGNTAFITEGGDDRETYSDCVTQTK
jgi:membrane-bound inhibitor of C-type lysozyme